MTKLAAWSLDRRQRTGLKRVKRAPIDLEKHLEDWIVEDVTLIGEGLTLVGRQITVDDGRLDLLAIDARDRWVVIEVKPGVLNSGALSQALYYASSIARLDAEELQGKIASRLGDANQLSERVKQQLADEGEERQVAVMLVGVGIHSGLERMKEFLGRFGVPISVVSFDVFETDSGQRLLVREVEDEATEPQQRSRRRLTVEAIRSWAVDVGVGGQFDRFVRIAQAAGLAVQPQRASIRIAPPSNRTRFLMYAQPHAGVSGGELRIHVGPKRFAEFFPHVEEREAIDALGGLDGKCVGGETLDALLDEIERFLTEKVQQPEVNGE